MNKSELRKSIREQKRKYTADQLLSWSAAIISELERQKVFIEARTILAYCSLPDEVNTIDFINRWAGKKDILLPVVKGDSLDLRRYSSPEQLVKGAFGISEPTGTVVTDYSQIDLAIVPGMAFDNEGNRLGRGKGYYDRLLPHLTAYKVGICFPFQLVDCVPTEATDVPMNKVITCARISSL